MYITAKLNSEEEKEHPCDVKMYLKMVMHFLLRIVFQINLPSPVTDKKS
jgi:hypothetical protein